MKNLTTEIAEVFMPRPLGTDEFVGEDGLVWCAKCRMPRQIEREVAGRIYRPYVQCQCQRAAYDREQAQRKRVEELDKIARMRAAGLQDPWLHKCRFDRDHGYVPQIRRARLYADNWPSMAERGTGLLIWGPVGTGKTFAAGCIANALLEQGMSVLMTSFPRILNAVAGMYQDQRGAFFSSLGEYDLLVLDDLGVERQTEYGLEIVYNVIDTRYRSSKPMIVTTNLTLDEMKQQGDLVRMRIYDRILERCIPVAMSGIHVRGFQAAMNMDWGKEFLE